MLKTSELQHLEFESGNVLLSLKNTICSLWTRPLSLTYKDVRDVVTNADIEIENVLRSKLTRLFPLAGFIVEEGKTVINKDYNWVIDPIDGTKNFSSHLPMFFTQIALLYKNTPILGIVYNPLSNQIFSASLGNGSKINNEKILFKKSVSFQRAIIDFDFSTPEQWKIDIFKKIALNCYRIRSSGGYLAPYILTGSIDAFINFVVKDFSFNQSPKNIADIAPHHILMTEAGITIQVVNLGLNKHIYIAAQSPLLLQIIDLLKKKR